MTIKQINMDNQFITIVVFASIAISILVIYWIYKIHINTQKSKNLLYAILTILSNQNTQNGEKVDLFELYKKGEKL